MIENISRETLENLGIYELRNVARQVGVYSPTTCKKGDLIEKIMAIVLGEEVPYTKKTNQGRPAKSISGLDEILKIFVPTYENENFYQKTHAKEQVFSPTFFENIKVLPENVESFSGYLKMLPNNYAVVFQKGYFENNQNSYYITPTMLKESNLKEGDYVRGFYYYSGKDKPKIVKEISTVNGIVQEINLKSERIDFSALEAVYPVKQIKLARDEKSYVDFKIIDKICPIAEGSRVAIEYADDFDIDDYIVELNNELGKKQGRKITMLAVDERPEDLSFIRNSFVELNVLNHADLDVESFVEGAKLSIKYLEHLVEKGENQILILKNVQKLKNTFEKYFISTQNKSELEAKVQASQLLKEILLLAKNTNSERSLTILAFNCKDDELIELCNCRIYLNEKPFEKTDIYLDCVKSKTLKADLILGKDEFKKIVELKNSLSAQNFLEKLDAII